MGQLTAKQFEDAAGTDDWRALAFGACAWFRTQQQTAAADLLAEVVDLARSAQVPVPDVDIRPGGVRLRLFDRSLFALTEAHLVLAAQVSNAAARRGLVADPSALYDLQLSMDVRDREAVMPFWEKALGYVRFDDHLVDPTLRRPSVFFQQMTTDESARAAQRNRIHIDAGLAYELGPERVSALEEKGGKVAYRNEDWWATVADREGNEVDIFPLAGTDDLADTDADDWRGMLSAAVHYPTTDPTTAVHLVEAVARLADAAGFELLVDVRDDGVSIESGKDRWEADGFVRLAADVQAAARRLGLSADRTKVLDVQVGIDALGLPQVRDFWTAVLGYTDLGNGHDDIADPHWLGFPLMFQQLDKPRPERNRIHLDCFIPADQVEARIGAALQAGGRIVYDKEAPEWWTIADPEGNELDLAVSVGREELWAESPTD